MRADRLVAALLILQSRRRVTAAELARELEVSEKTARRDLEALGMAGIPVYPIRGRNGGWELLGGGRTDLSGLTADEATTLFLAAGASTTITADTRSALRKLARALPETFRASAEVAASAVIVDPTDWGTDEAPPPPRHLELLQRCIIERRRVVLAYTDRTRAATERSVDPYGLVSKGTVWYLIAGTEKGMRTFRVSRVRDVTLTDEIVERPADFDLSAAWRQVTAAVGEHRTSVRCTIRIEHRHVGGLRAQFGSDLMVAELDELDDGRVEVIVGGPAPIVIAQHLAGWGSLVEVIEPDEVRVHLARIGHELLDRYTP